MLIDLVSSDNTLSINKTLAKIVGLHPAIYVAEILNVMKDSKTDSFVVIDRAKINEEILISATEQSVIESKLQLIGLIIKDPKNSERLYVDIKTLINLYNEDNKAILKKISKITETKTSTFASAGKLTSREAQRIELRSKINSSNEELLEAYKDWVDGVYANPRGFLSVRSINIFQKSIDEYANGNLDLALKIIEIATVNGYREAQWAINLFEKEHLSTFNKRFNAQSKNSIKSKTVVAVDEEVF